MMWTDLVDRQKGIRNIDDALNNAIRETKIAIFGAGGNGAVLDFLVRTGFEHFEILDYDVVEASNLNRLPFFQDAIGLPKVEAWEKYLKQVNPAVCVKTHNRKITKQDETFTREMVNRADIVGIETSSFESVFVVARICHHLRKRMIAGPGTSASWVVTTFTHEDDTCLESVADFNTTHQDLKNIDYPSLIPKFRRIYEFPGKKERFDSKSLEKVMTGEIAPRSAKMFVSLVNAAQCWECVKNVAIMNHLPLEHTDITRFPLMQIFDPFKGSAYYFHASEHQIGIPNWLTDEINWYKAPG